MTPKQPFVAAFALLLATAGVARASDADGTISVTSDYIFRGISQTQDDPALQAGARLGLDDGAYVSTWTSSLKPLPDNGADAELDLVAGWRGSLTHDLTLDANVTRYTYPGAKRSTSDYNELVSTLTWRDRIWVQGGWSNDVFASGRAALYTQFGGRQPLSHGFAIEAAAGRYKLSSALGRSYAHAYVAAEYTSGAFTARVALHDTDHAATVLFPHLAGPHVEISTSYAF